jgi:hypothetical protein
LLNSASNNLLDCLLHCYINRWALTGILLEDL